MFFIVNFKLIVCVLKIFYNFNLLELIIDILHPDIYDDTHDIKPTLLKLN